MVLRFGEVPLRYIMPFSNEEVDDMMGKPFSTPVAITFCVVMISLLSYCGYLAITQKKAEVTESERLCKRHDGVHSTGRGKSAPKELVYCNDGTVKWMD
jgi:hypothetical protein